MNTYTPLQFSLKMRIRQVRHSLSSFECATCTRLLQLNYKNLLSNLSNTSCGWIRTQWKDQRPQDRRCLNIVSKDDAFFKFWFTTWWAISEHSCLFFYLFVILSINVLLLVEYDLLLLLLWLLITIQTHLLCAASIFIMIEIVSEFSPLWSWRQ